MGDVAAERRESVNLHGTPCDDYDCPTGFADKEAANGSKDLLTYQSTGLVK